MSAYTHTCAHAPAIAMYVHRYALLARNVRPAVSAIRSSFLLSFAAAFNARIVHSEDGDDHDDGNIACQGDRSRCRSVFPARAPETRISAALSRKGCKAGVERRNLLKLMRRVSNRVIFGHDIYIVSKPKYTTFSK